jgi:hypothetical protein
MCVFWVFVAILALLVYSVNVSYTYFCLPLCALRQCSSTTMTMSRCDLHPRDDREGMWLCSWSASFPSARTPHHLVARVAQTDVRSSPSSRSWKTCASAAEMDMSSSLTGTLWLCYIPIGKDVVVCGLLRWPGTSPDGGALREDRIQDHSGDPRRNCFASDPYHACATGTFTHPTPSI